MADRDPVARHVGSAKLHAEAADRHEKAAKFWSERGDDVRADLERRNATIEREAAQLERDRAAAEEANPHRPPAEDN